MGNARFRAFTGSCRGDGLVVVIGACLQDWITVRGQNDTISVTQGSSGWLELGDMEDLAFFLDVRELSSPAPQLVYETAPTKQDAMFKAMLPAFTPAVGQRVDRVFTSTAAVPPARYVRWKLQHGGVPWDITFRLWLGAYAWRRSG